MNRGGNVARERPGRRGPSEQILTLVVGAREWQPDGERQVSDLPIALGRDLHVRQPGAAPRAPGHDVMALVNEPARVAFLQEGPDRVVVLVAVGEVAVLPVHPHPEPRALLGLERREGIDPCLA